MMDKTTETIPTAEDIDTIEKLVAEVSHGNIPTFIAINRAARLGWVLIPEYPTIAQHVSSRQCASCKQWKYLGYHMGICGGSCAIHKDSRKDTDSCSKWGSALE
jgi:hypothetical protein